MILTSVAFRSKLLDASERIIRSKIDLYNTKMCTNTTGVPFVMYQEASQGAHAFSTQKLPASSSYGVVPNLSLNWSYGSPFYMNIPYYSVEIDGYFYAEQNSGSLKFYIFGHGVTANLYFNGSTRISDTALTHSPSVFGKSSNLSVTGGNWYTFRVQFWGDAGIRNAGISVQYTYDAVVTEDNFRNNKFKVVNAGVCSANNSFISATSVTNFSNIRGRRVKNEPTTYSFDVPLGDETGAYKKNASNEYSNGTASLQEGKLVRIYAGYLCDSTPNSAQTEGTVVGNVEYIPRFTGYIESFDINRSSDTMTVNCKDFFGMAESNFCVNYPDSTSYWSARYFKDAVTNEPYGLQAPTAYDRWGVVDAILDLFMKAGIPASIFYGMEYARQSDNTITQSIPSVYNAGFLLAAARYYGTDQAEEYVNKYDVGTTVHEAIMKIVDTYGYHIDFKPNGNLRFYPQDNPTADVSAGNESKIDDSSASTSGTVTTTTNSKATTGNYSTIDNDAGGTITFSNIPATGFTLIAKRDASSGLNNNNNQYWSGTASVQIDININGGSNVASYDYNFYYEEEWFYTDGVSQLIGTNPCIIPLDKDLPYDNYDVVITSLSDSYDISVDELWVYHHNISSPVKQLQTYKTVSQIATIGSVDFKRDINDLRNDVLVVGQRRGYWVPSGDKEVGIDDPEMQAQRNAQYVNYNSRSMDLESIYNPFATNYTGRHMMTYIQEPNINTDSRARWLSYSVLNNYRDFDNRVDLSVVGDPEITINDPITLLDKVEDDGTNLFWVVGADESIGKASWEISLNVIGKKPFPSYDENPDYDITQFNDGYFADLTIVDNFGYKRDGTCKSTLSGSHLWTATTLNLTSSNSTWDSAGTLVVYKSNSPHYGIFVYTSKPTSTSVSGSFKYVTPQGFSSTDYSAGDGWKVENIYNPYEQADYGGFIKMTFTCLVDGNVYVGVKSILSGLTKFVTGLSAGGGLDDSFIPKMQRVFPGDIVEVIWGGVDESGVTHIVTSEDNEIGGGFFAEDGNYILIMSYERSSDNTVKSISTSGYKDDEGVDQRHIIELAKSQEDNHQLSYVYRASNLQGNTNQYVQGGDGRRFTVNTSLSMNTNYIWINGDDGSIDLSLKSHFVNESRLYFVTYRTHVVTAHLTTSPLTGYAAQIKEEYPMEQRQLNDGNPCQWSFSNVYTVYFDPVRPIFGGIDIDAVWIAYYNEHISPIGIGTQIFAQAYWLRLIIDIRDASGRRVKFVSSNGEIHAMPTNILDRSALIYDVYRNVSGDTVVEFMVVPTGVHEGVGTFGFVPTSNIVHQRPTFEAITSYPMCIVE